MVLKDVMPATDTANMDYQRAQRLFSRATAGAVGLGLFFWPDVSAWLDPVLAALVPDLYDSVLRLGGLLWLSLAFGSWESLARATALWPGADPHNLYGFAGVALGVVAAVGLMAAIVLLPLGIALSFTHTVAWPLLVPGGLGGLVGTAAMRASRNCQELAAERDRLTGPDDPLQKSG